MRFVFMLNSVYKYFFNSYFRFKSYALVLKVICMHLVHVKYAFQYFCYLKIYLLLKNL